MATHGELGLVTHGETFEKLLVNLREALEVSLEDAAELNIVSEPRVLLNRRELNLSLWYNLPSFS